MSNTPDDRGKPRVDLFAGYMALLGDQALSSVHHWKLPNDDVPFDEAASAEHFEATADAAFDALSEAIEAIGTPDARRPAAKSG